MHGASPAGTRAHLPSYFFRAAAEALTGRPVPIATIDSLPPELFERVPANRFGAATPDEALTDGEFDRTLFDNCLELGTDVPDPPLPNLRSRSPCLGRSLALGPAHRVGRRSRLRRAGRYLAPR